MTRRERQVSDDLESVRGRFSSASSCADLVDDGPESVLGVPACPRLLPVLWVVLDSVVLDLSESESPVVVCSLDGVEFGLECEQVLEHLLPGHKRSPALQNLATQASV